MPLTKELSIERRVGILTEYENGISVSDIAKKYNCHRNTILYQVNKKKIQGNLENISGRGRKRVTNSREDQRIRRTVERNPRVTLRALTQDFNLTRPATETVSCYTVHRRLKELNYKTYTCAKKFFITEGNKKIRLEFALKYRDKSTEFWRNILWTDESAFSLDGTYGKKIYRSNSGKKKDQIVQNRHSDGGKLMIWGCISYNGIGPVMRLPEKVTSSVYLDVLNNCAFVAGDKLISPDFVLQQDNAPIHTSRLIKNFLHEVGQDVLDWPPQSPDLNVIENVWHIMKSQVSQNFGRTKDDVWKDVIQVWSQISVETCRNLIDSVPRRLQEVIEARGGHTSY